MNKKNYPLTDTGNAEILISLFGDSIRYDHRRKRWLIWEDHRWRPDADGTITKMAIESSRERARRAVDLEHDQRIQENRWAIQSESKLRLDAMTSIAKNLDPVADKGEGWDANPMLLSCPNGILNLTTGEFRDGKQEDRITMSTRAEYHPEAGCPLWKKFIGEVFQNDEELIHFVQKALGYSLTGDISEQVLFFCYGSGSNGKSVLFQTIRVILGDYAHSASPTLFQRNTLTTSSNDVAAIEFKRFLVSAEILSSTKINELRLKKWSGGDEETARYLYSEYFSFYPECKVWLFLNHRPQVEDDSYGFWRRVKLIPFEVIFKGERQDKNLQKKLKGELSGILNWLFEGCLMWQEEGLEPIPEIVQLATTEYRFENDILGEFINDRCVECENLEVKATALFKNYREWADGQDIREKEQLSMTSFGRRMTDKYPKVKKPMGLYYKNIGLKIDQKDENHAGFGKNSEADAGLTPDLLKIPINNSHIESLLKTTPNPATLHSGNSPTGSLKEAVKTNTDTVSTSATSATIVLDPHPSRSSVSSVASAAEPNGHFKPQTSTMDDDPDFDASETTEVEYL